MKYLVVFAAVLAVALAGRSKWHLRQISRAIESPLTNPSLLPVLEHALEVYMDAIFASQDHEYMTIGTAEVDLGTWSLREISSAIENPNTSPALMPYFVHALEVLMDGIFSQAVPSSTTVAITVPAMDISYWTMPELDYALSHDPTPEITPYLEQGVQKLMESAWTENRASFVVLTIPVDIVDAASPVEPSPAVHPGNEIEVGSEIVPSPVVVAPEAPAPATSSSPLVEIILNINQQSAGESPVVITEPFENPRPTVPGFDNRPIPVEEVVPGPIITPTPVIPGPEVNPIDVIAVSP